VIFIVLTAKASTAYEVAWSNRSWTKKGKVSFFFESFPTFLYHGFHFLSCFSCE